MNFKGGYKIIDLRSLTLTPSEDGATLIDIEDSKVLLQLDSLKEYLDVSKDLKPIYLRVTDNDTVMCELKRDIENSTFYIHAILMGYVLMISAAFTQDEETLFWYVDEAKYLYVSDEVKLEKGVLPFIEADKDIISKVTIEVDEENNKTCINFPAGIIPVRMVFKSGLTTQVVYTKGYDYLVDDEANDIYPLDEIVYDGAMYITLDNDYNIELVGLTYIRSQGTSECISNSYNIFHPESVIKEEVESGALSNAKSIYYHSLDAYDTSNKNDVCITILNNSDAPINTVAKLKAWAEAISGKVLIPCHGIVRINSVRYHTLFIVKNSNNTYTIYYMTDNGYANEDNVDLDNYFSGINDAVNKIN